MLFSNANIFRPEGTFRPGSFTVENGRFGEITDSVTERADVDLKGLCVIPGLVDIHSHGNSGFDFSEAKEGSMEAMTRYWASCGVTSVTPASMTVSLEMLEKAYRMADSFRDQRPEGCARIQGVNMEGPFFSYNKRGAQNPAYLLKPSADAVRRLDEASHGIIRLVDVAPELEGSMAFINEMSRDHTVSIAHTETSYETAKEAISCGATNLTHLFNAMPGIHHRNPGPIAAGSENESVYGELICDGMHVAPSVIRMAFRLFPGRICIISDSLSCCGLPDGEYVSGGLPVTLKDNLCRLSDGTIAGSVCDAYQGMLNCLKFGISREETILAATINPAHQARCDREVGSIEQGKLADFVVCREDLTREAVYIGGKKI